MMENSEIDIKIKFSCIINPHEMENPEFEIKSFSVALFTRMRRSKTSNSLTSSWVKDNFNPFNMTVFVSARNLRIVKQTKQNVSNSNCYAGC